MAEIQWVWFGLLQMHQVEGYIMAEIQWVWFGLLQMH